MASSSRKPPLFAGWSVHIASASVATIVPLADHQHVPSLSALDRRTAIPTAGGTVGAAAGSQPSDLAPSRALLLLPFCRPRSAAAGPDGPSSNLHNAIPILGAMSEYAVSDTYPASTSASTSALFAVEVGASDAHRPRVVRRRGPIHPFTPVDLALRDVERDAIGYLIDRYPPHPQERRFKPFSEALQGQSHALSRIVDSVEESLVEPPSRAACKASSCHWTAKGPEMSQLPYFL